MIEWRFIISICTLCGEITILIIAYQQTLALQVAANAMRDFDARFCSEPRQSTVSVPD
jgi:hypothetical protein